MVQTTKLGSGLLRGLIVLIRDEALGPAHRDKTRCPGVQYDLMGCIIHGIKVIRAFQMLHQCFFDLLWI
jgi:hypothetical protein